MIFFPPGMRGADPVSIRPASLDTQKVSLMLKNHVQFGVTTVDQPFFDGIKNCDWGNSESLSLAWREGNHRQW
jgi:hypothetical protein